MNAHQRATSRERSHWGPASLISCLSANSSEKGYSGQKLYVAHSLMLRPRFTKLIVCHTHLNVQ